MKKIYFKGYYGYKNLGDDIFTLSAEWICNNIWGNSKPIIIGENLPQVAQSTKKIIVKHGFMKNIIEFLVCIFSSKIIYFGGSLFTGGSTNYKDLKFYIKKIPFLYNKTGTIGTSIGPFKNEKAYMQIKDFLSKIKFIAVRDYSSENIVKEMNLEDKSCFSFDNAILIKEVFPSLKKRTQKQQDKVKIAISLCRYESYNNMDILKEKKREDAIKEFLNTLLQKNNIDEFVFIVFNGNPSVGDLAITREFNDYFSDKVNTEIVDYSEKTEGMLSEINDCDFLLGVRLHSGIVAYALEIPFMLIEYHNKCTEFLNTVNHNYRFDIDNVEETFSNFRVIIENKKIPNIKEPDFFKEIMIKELKKIEI